MNFDLKPGGTVHKRMYRILWIQDYMRGPYNGLVANEKEEKFWFQRMPDQEMSSSTEVAARTTPYYKIVKLEPQLLELVEDDHVKYCEATGKPLKHGDSWSFKRDKIILYQRRYEPTQLQGETIEFIDNSKFLNL